MVKERIYEYLSSKGITPTASERSLGWGVGAITKAKSITADRVKEFLLFYTDLSPEWLLTGKSEMLRSDNKPIRIVENIETRPMLPCKAEAGKLTDYANGVTEEQCKMKPIVKDLPRYDFTIQIFGESMMPEYKSGDEVACRRILNANEINWGMAYILDTMRGVVFKRIYECGDNIRCVSYNKEYSDLIIPKDEVFSYNLVVGLIRSYTI